jgi:hypothetical protein
VSIAVRSWFFVLPVCISLLAGCDMAARMEESMAHGKPIEAEIERAVGKMPDVISVSTAAMLIVTVNFSEVPSLPVPALEAIARAAVIHEFKKEPNSLTIAFVYQKW